jgi:hypothetical protein
MLLETRHEHKEELLKLCQKRIKNVDLIPHCDFITPKQCLSSQVTKNVDKRCPLMCEGRRAKEESSGPSIKE